MAMPDRYRQLRDRLFLRAALSDSFSPRLLLQEVLRGEERIDLQLRGQLMSALREACTEEAGAAPEKGGALWRMRLLPRHKSLEAAAPARDPAADLSGDLPDTPIVRALQGRDGFAPDRLRRLIDGLEPVAAEELAGLVAVLEQAGPGAPGHPLLAGLGSLLDRLRGAALTDALLEQGILGRAEEIARIRAALAAPQRAPPLRTVHIQGLPGLGKTFLLEQVIRECRDLPDMVLIRLDFDRSSLQTGDTAAVFDEISRQIGTAIPEAAAALQDQRLREAERRTSIGANTTETVAPFEHLHQMIELVAGRGRRLLFLLDTLEVLHGHGETFVGRLLEELDRFAAPGSIPINLISAGRGSIFGEDHPRLRALIPLEGLENQVIQAILERRGVQPGLRRRIARLSQGNPLRLLLVTRAVQESGGSLGEEQIRQSTNGYLYRAILSRVPADIRRIASEGLILPCLDAEALTGIVAPALGQVLSPAEAEALLETLAAQSWLVRRDPAGGLVHRDELRAEFLELTYAENPQGAAEINRRAAAHHDGRDPALRLYHLLQLTRAGEPMPGIDAALALRLTGRLFDDLPPPARDAVLRARGERARGTAPPRRRADPAPRPPGAARPRRRPDRAGMAWLQVAPGSARLMRIDPPAEGQPENAGDLTDLRNMLEAGALREASFLVRQRFRRPFPADGPTGLLLLAHQWRTGQWGIVRRLQPCLDMAALEGALHDDVGLTGLVLLEIWAEFRFDELCARLRQDDFLALAGRALGQIGRGGLRAAALEFAMLCARGPGLSGENEAAGAVARWLPEAPPHAALALHARAQALRAGFGLELAPAGQDPREMDACGAALAMAPVNPYGQPIRALIDTLADAGAARVPQAAESLGPRLGELSALLMPGLSGLDTAQARLASGGREALALIQAMGLVAEFAGGVSSLVPAPDLLVLARAAARWQQATLGLWGYGRNRPAGWACEARIDPLAQERALRLLARPDATEAARRAFHIWQASPDRPPPADSPPLRAALAGIAADLPPGAGLDERLALVQRAGIIPVQQAPLAVLSRRDGSDGHWLPVLEQGGGIITQALRSGGQAG
ncbi:AAA family ATPase [Paracoccus sp. PS-1]|uniref:AAA family ATPase n=1 Tax=Paracoccus sp. PS1 TaxID=2963938 RepID=UPI0027E57EA5|nr:AAA family ATPase [Paracoccus sp. PS1]MDQ7261895.1 AAA family ATPase [Paracoccus sp. PS1]